MNPKSIGAPIISNKPVKETSKKVTGLGGTGGAREAAKIGSLTDLYMTKQSAAASEVLGSILWAPTGSTVAGAIPSAMTKKQTRREMLEQNKKDWSNILVPGMAGYRLGKRFGHHRDRSKK